MKTISNISSVGTASAAQLTGVCPGCNREGNLMLLGQDLVLQFPASNADPHKGIKTLFVGHRQCPGATCKTHLFVVYESNGLRYSFPAGRIDFDTTDVPVAVRQVFDESLTCAANDCYVAAGMLIRKTLEHVCEERGAKGADLKSRIGDLRSKVTLPNELFEAMDHLRLLGNDAAHIEAKTYNDVGKAEIETGIELTKEIIKSTYQYKGLLEKLQALRRP